MRCRHTCALIVRIGFAHRRRRAGVQRRQDAAACPATGRCDRHRRAVVAVGRTSAGNGRRRHHDDPRTTRRDVVRRISAIVARRNHDGHTRGDRIVDGVLSRRITRPQPPQAHVDDLGRVGVGGHARYGQTGGPANTVDDVVHAATALTQHPHGQNLGRPVDTGDTSAVVGHGGDRASHVRTMPRTALRRSAVTLIVGKPIARVRWVSIAPVAVVARPSVRNKVVARDVLGIEV